MQADATDFAAQATGLRHDDAATGPLVTEEALQFQSTGALSPAAHQAAAAGQSPLTLLQLPADVLMLVLCWLDTRSLTHFATTCAGLYRDKPRPMTPAEQGSTLLQLPPEILRLVLQWLDARSREHLDATCSGLYRNQPRPMTLVEETLRQRAAARGRVSPVRLPEGGGSTSWVAHLACLESRCDDEARAEAWAPVAAGFWCSLFVAEGGRLMSCGDVRFGQGALGHGCLNVISTPTPLPSMAGIRISSVSAGNGFNVGVSASRKVYTWGSGYLGQLGHGDENCSLVPKQVQAMAGHSILSVAAGNGHCLAVTERGEVFSWGRDDRGQCGHGSSGQVQLLPRRVEALVGVWARSASAGCGYSLVVIEKGALYSFGDSSDGQLGHGSVDDERSPRMVDALRHMRITAAAAGCDHALALTEDGMVFSWGGNGKGQLGLGRNGNAYIPTLSAPLPQRIEALIGTTVSFVVAGDAASCAVASSGELFTWGHGRYGQLGHGDAALVGTHANASNQMAPRRVEALQGESVVAVSVGAGHFIAVARSGSVFGWGDAGSLGLLDNANGSVNADGIACIFSPCRYPQLSCVRCP
jgi:alpha-tubulin suppressor-like RCC1 family protein